MKKTVLLIISLYFFSISKSQKVDSLWNYYNYSAVFCQPFANGNQPTGWGTGFITTYKSRSFLITNYHNVNDTDAFGRLMHNKGKPNQLRLFLHLPTIGRYKMISLPLYGINGKPNFYSYTYQGSTADVVAIEIVIPKECIFQIIKTDESQALNNNDKLIYIGYPEFPEGDPMPLLGMANFKINEEATAVLKSKTNIPYHLIEPTLVKGFSGSPILSYNNKEDKLSLRGIVAQSLNYTSQSGTNISYAGIVPTYIINNLLSQIK